MTHTYDLHWIPQAVANVLHNNNIHDRAELAKAIGISRATVYRVFNEEWAGRATIPILAAMACRFRVPIGRLVAEPALAGKR